MCVLEFTGYANSQKLSFLFEALTYSRDSWEGAKEFDQLNLVGNRYAYVSWATNFSKVQLVIYCILIHNK